MDAALRRALRSATGPATGCDAELTAAYAEGRLKGAERQRLESHLTLCASCRALATAMLQEKPESHHTAARPWWSWRWAVPAMAGVVLVGSVVYYQRSQVLERPARQVAQVVSAPAAPPAAPQQRADQSVIREKAVGGGPEHAPASQPRAGERAGLAPAGIRRSIPKPTAPEPVAEPASLSEPAVVADALKSRLDENKKEAAAAPAQQQLLTAGQASGKMAAGAPAAYVQSAAANLAKQPFPPAPLPEGAPLRHFTQRGPLVWAVSDGGRIFRSADGGETWTKLESPTTNDLVRVVWESETKLVVEDKQGNRYTLRP
ncbi:MAG: zf-HC2 domain-containing protein [Acidobacteria bacterium]|nr:zf-HC2 domain-containing protein [Acidobacteriota bacterium]